MPVSPIVLTMTSQERAVLRQGRAAAARASLLLATAVATGCAALVAMVSSDFDRGVLVVVVVLCAWWSWLLRAAPRRWRGASKDLAGQRVAMMGGNAGLHVRRGIGLLAPVTWMLHLDGRELALTRAQALDLREGTAVEARIAPMSGLLLSLVPAASSVSVPGVVAGAALTPREAELLQLIAAGCSDKEIAKRLGLEPATVRTYNSQLYAKLGAGRRTEAVARARAIGLLTDVKD